LKLVEVSVKRPVGVFMFVIAIVALGLFSLRSLAIDLFPKIDLPIAIVATSYSGAAPEEVENLISRPLEASLSSVQGIDTIQSQSQAGSSMIILMFNNGTNLDNALLDVRERVDQIKGMLPEDAGDPSVLRFDPQQLPVLSIGLYGHEAERLQQIADDQVVPILERQNGVASVSVQGGQTREILVELDKGKLAQYNITAMQVVQALRSENSSASAGSVSKGAGELQVRVKGDFTSLRDITNTLIHLPTGGQLKVGDVATINDTFAKQTSLSIVNGMPALVLSVQKQSDANTVQVADEVFKALESLEDNLSAGTELDVIMDLSLPIRQSIDSVINNMISGGLLAILILIVFLRSARSTLVIGLSIPIAVIATFMLMYFSGQTINMITMGGLALGVGMMVDSSIVILENIFSYRERGLPMKEAAIKGASELGSAVIASTLTTVVVFLPMVFVKGLAADIFMPMAYAVSFSLVASLVVALTLVPMLSSTFIPEAKKQKVQRKWWTDRVAGRILAGYKRMLKWVLGHRKSTVFLTIAMLVGSLALIPFIGMEFFPASDQGQFQIQVETPSGTKIEETKLVADQVSKLFEPYEDIIDNAYVTIGSSGFGTGSANTATFTVQMVGASERDMTTTEVVQALDARAHNIPGAEITVSEIQTGLGTGSAIQIAINGEDQETIKSIADQVIWTISSIEGVYNPTTSASNGNSELNIVVDREVAAHYGLTYQQIISEIQLSINGQTATQYREEGNEYNVKVILPEDQRSDIAALSTLTIQTASGRLVPLSAVAELNQLQGPAMIQRENQQRQINVTSEVVGRDLGSVSADVQEALSKMNFPEGYTYSFGGQSQDMLESFADLGMALIFSIFLVYVVMAIQFESLLNPFIIMFAMPTMFIGILVGLFLTGKSLSMPALIGVIMLAGVVVNNAIILVDYVNILRRRGLTREEAILEGAPSRVRPIFMTTLTTVLGLIPLALGIGEGAEMQAPLAIVVIFGLSFSTIFTLLLIPVMYTISEDLSDWLKRRFTGGDTSLIEEYEQTGPAQ
jgi:CzcA family heavy metal efflux pump